ncbi:MAG: hypothetical protein R2911_18925 [Caldilineaceae bacterium]
MSKFLLYLGVIIAVLIALAGCSSTNGAEYLQLGGGGTIDLEMLGLADDARIAAAFWSGTTGRNRMQRCWKS